MPTGFRMGKSSFFGFHRIATEKGPQFLFEIGKVDLHSFNSIFDFLQTNLLVGLVGTINSLLVAILLDDLATIPDLIEAQGSRRSL